MKTFNILLLFLLLLPLLNTDSPESQSLQDSTEMGNQRENSDVLNIIAVIVAAAIVGVSTYVAQKVRYKRKLIEIEKEKEVDIARAREQVRLDLLEKHEAKKKEKILATEEDRYLNFVINENEKLTFQGFETSVRAPILLWDVYVPLRANMAGLGMRDMERMDPGKMPDDRDLSIEEAVQFATDKQYDGLIILGDPGAGKSTLLKYFLLCFAKKEAARRLNLPGDMLPILLHLRSVNVEQTFIENICAGLRDYDLKLTEEFLRNILEKGKAIVLLDGLDEVAHEKARKNMCTWIQRTRTSFHKCPFIVTSRFAGYRGDVKLPGTYLELHMQDFTEEDIRKFLHSWYTAVETALHEDNNYWRTRAQKAAEELYTRIEGTKKYLKLAINPLMLQLIALVHYDFKTVPNRRAELYDKCIDLLLQKWDESKGLKTLLTAQEARQILQPLALWMHSVENRRQASKKEILTQINPHIQQVKPGVEADKFLTSIRDRSGVFVGYGTESYGFQHLSFQEYLTAEEIRNTGKVEVLVDHFDESWWREPTLLTLALGNPSIFEPFMQKFLHSDKNNGAAADFMLRCVKETLVKSEEPLVEVLHNPQNRWQARYNAMLCLEAIGSDAAKAAVQKHLKDTVPEIAGKARELLIEWGQIKVEEIVERDLETGELRRYYNPTEDNAEYILIPSGTYTMGELKREVMVEPFYLAKFPVTNRLYGLFMKVTDYNKPRYWDDKRYNEPDQPVVGVCWDDAVAYCKWLSQNSKDEMEFRLPTEEEWEWAAGRGERKYPWGNKEPAHNRANYEYKVGQPTPVGNYPDGATPDGLMDMAGNVWEWMASAHEKGEQYRVLRGGSFGIGASDLRCSFRLRVRRHSWWGSVGFRVVCVSSGHL